MREVQAMTENPHNDTFANAIDTGFSSQGNSSQSFRGEIGDNYFLAELTDDVDFYSFVGGAGDRFAWEITADGVPWFIANNIFGTILFDEDSNILKFSTQGSDSFAFILPDNGTYYLAVYGGSPNGATYFDPNQFPRNITAVSTGSYTAELSLFDNSPNFPVAAALPTLAIAATNAVRGEGNTGTTPFTLTVTRTGDTTGTSSANWAVTGTGTNPANAADFGGTLPTGTVSFAAGVTSQVITVNVSGDTVLEPDEAFTATLSNPSNATITTATATGTIINDDLTNPSQLAIAPTNAIQSEGNTGNTPYTFTVTRTGDTSTTSTANWAVTGTGTNPANAGDFGGTLPTGTVTFAAGVTSQVITVNVSGDTVVEPDEAFTVTLSNPSNATITTATATGTIRNDDTPQVQGDRQQITSLDNLTAAPGGNVSIPLLYKTSTGDNTLTGISLRLHYNSNELSFQNADNLFNNNLFVAVEDLADDRNLDNDPQSDRYIQFGYTDFAGNWPNQTLPLKLGDFNFTTTDNFTGTQLNLTSDNLAPGYSLEADPILVSKQAWNLDIDGNGEIKALSDGIMIVRHLFGTFPGERLTQGAIAPNATRNLAEIQAYLQQGVDNKYLDVDGNGEIKALSDGIMIVRHLFGTFPDERLINGAISPDATRDLTQIQEHLTQFSTVI
jgi:hypothetical protein